jgi:hypothetical protein
MKAKTIYQAAAILAVGGVLAGCIYAPPPPVAYAPQGYYGYPAYAYPAYPYSYYPAYPAVGAVNLGFEFGGHHHH